MNLGWIRKILANFALCQFVIQTAWRLVIYCQKDIIYGYVRGVIEGKRGDGRQFVYINAKNHI